MGRSRPQLPYRKSRSIPRLKSPSDKRKVVFYEYGNDYNPNTGKSSIYVDILDGNADLVDYVGFRFWPSGETHNVRKRSTIQLSDGTFVRRFIVKPSSVKNWSRKLTIVVFGKGGSRRVRRLRAKNYGDFRERPLKFLETKPLRNVYAEAPSFYFGIEIETSVDSTTTPTDVVQTIRQKANVPVLDKTTNYRRGNEDHYANWQLVPDGSTTCSLRDPNCNKFELVSRILQGESGLQECRKVISALNSVGRISINQSMGFHVHVNVQHLSLEQKKNICLNFIKHEQAMDSILPPSRNASDYCKSNRDSMIQETMGLKHRAIASCSNLGELCDRVNPGPKESARYYKLNLQNLNPKNTQRKQAKPTFEFRQHSGTTDFEKIEAWVRFCTAFCYNSKERPSKLKRYEDPFQSLFDTVIQDIKLKAFYSERQKQFLKDHHNGRDVGGEACCGPCAKEGMSANCDACN